MDSRRLDELIINNGTDDRSFSIVNSKGYNFTFHYEPFLNMFNLSIGFSVNGEDGVPEQCWIYKRDEVLPASQMFRHGIYCNQVFHETLSDSNIAVVDFRYDIAHDAMYNEIQYEHMTIIGAYPKLSRYRFIDIPSIGTYFQDEWNSAKLSFDIEAIFEGVVPLKITTETFKKLRFMPSVSLRMDRGGMSCQEMYERQPAMETSDLLWDIVFYSGNLERLEIDLPCIRIRRVALAIPPKGGHLKSVRLSFLNLGEMIADSVQVGGISSSGRGNEAWMTFGDILRTSGSVELMFSSLDDYSLMRQKLPVGFFTMPRTRNDIFYAYMHREIGEIRGSGSSSRRGGGSAEVKKWRLGVPSNCKEYRLSGVIADEELVSAMNANRSDVGNPSTYKLRLYNALWNVRAPSPSFAFPPPPLRFISDLRVHFSEIGGVEDVVLHDLYNLKVLVVDCSLLQLANVSFFGGPRGSFSVRAGRLPLLDELLVEECGLDLIKNPNDSRSTLLDFSHLSVTKLKGVGHNPIVFDQVFPCVNGSELKLSGVDLEFCKKESSSGPGAGRATKSYRMKHLQLLNTISPSRDVKRVLGRDMVVHFGVLEELELQHFGIDHVQSGTLDLMPRLEKLILANNRIKRLDGDLTSDNDGYVSSSVLIRHKRMREVDLSFNFISALPPEGLCVNSSIGFLDLSHNSLTDVDFDKFMRGCNLWYNYQNRALSSTSGSHRDGSATSKIQGIDLSHNSLTSLVDLDLHTLLDLRASRDISRVSLEQIQVLERRLVLVPWVLDLSYNGLSHVVVYNSGSTSKRYFVGIKVGIDLSCNAITQLDHVSISGIEFLHAANLSHNPCNRGQELYQNSQMHGRNAKKGPFLSASCRQHGCVVDLSHSALVNDGANDLGHIRQSFVRVLDMSYLQPTMRGGRARPMRLPEQLIRAVISSSDNWPRDDKIQLDPSDDWLYYRTDSYGLFVSVLVRGNKHLHQIDGPLCFTEASSRALERHRNPYYDFAECGIEVLGNSILEQCTAEIKIMLNFDMNSKLACLPPVPSASEVAHGKVNGVHLVSAIGTSIRYFHRGFRSAYANLKSLSIPAQGQIRCCDLREILYSPLGDVEAAFIPSKETGLHPFFIFSKSQTSWEAPSFLKQVCVVDSIAVVPPSSKILVSYTLFTSLENYRSNEDSYPCSWPSSYLHGDRCWGPDVVPASRHETILSIVLGVITCVSLGSYLLVVLFGCVRANRMRKVGDRCERGETMWTYLDSIDGKIKLEDIPSIKGLDESISLENSSSYVHPVDIKDGNYEYVYEYWGGSLPPPPFYS